MKELFINKFFLISLIVVLVLTIILIVFNLTGHSGIISDIFNILIYPFRQFALILKESSQGFAGYFTEFNRLKAENKQLKEDLAAIQGKLEEYDALKEENEELYNYLDLKREYIVPTLLNADVIAREADNFRSVLTINRGSFHGLEKGLTVIYSDASEDNIIGFISEAGLFSSKVTLFIKPDISLGAYIKDLNLTGIITGDFESEQKGLCKFTYTAKDAEIEVGNKIYTSGLGELYPEGLFIGNIIDIEVDPYSQSLTGIVKPQVNFYKIKTVMVILDFERKYD